MLWMKGAVGSWIVAGLGLGALVFSAWWLAQPQESAEEEGRRSGFVLPVTLAEVARGDLYPRAILSGTVRAARRANLGFDAKGIVEALAVDEADVVEAGAVLAHLASGDEEHELAAAEAALALAVREHELLLAGERQEEIRRLAAALEAAEAAAELAKLEVERGEKLFADRIVAASEQDRRVAEYRVADKLRAAALEEHARAVAGTRSEDLAIAEARVEEARTRVATARHALGKTELRAPWAGSIVARRVSVGDYVSEGDPVFELVDLENLEVHVEVPARFAPRLGEEATAKITLPGADGFALEAGLDATISAADDVARSFRAIVRLGAEENAGRLLKPGMFVQLDLGLEPVKGALTVPSDSVLASDRGTYVVRAAPAPPGEGAPSAPSDPGGPGGPPAPPVMIAEFVPVRVLAQSQDRSAIRPLGASLSAGDSVVLVGADNAFPGASLLPRGTDRPSGGPPGEPPGASPEPGRDARPAEGRGDEESGKVAEEPE